ncbi:MAG: hypothetical protein GXP29_10545 [Planctomycetes bacterium]|nr:hypothetical protein [Planctomycetota bacterium]
MSDRYSAWIRIGGPIARSDVEQLLGEVQFSNASLDWGEPSFQPTSADALVDARKDGSLHLCDNEARYGEFLELEEICRELGLSYTRCSEAWCGYDAEIVDWRPDMAEPLVRTCSNGNSDTVFVDAATIVEALAAFDTGRTRDAIGTLRSLCPNVSALPQFDIV